MQTYLFFVKLRLLLVNTKYRGAKTSSGCGPHHTSSNNIFIIGIVYRTFLLCCIQNIIRYYIIMFIRLFPTLVLVFEKMLTKDIIQRVV